MHPVPGVFAGGSNTIAVLVLLTEFAMLRAALLRAQLRLYAAQSLLLSALAVIAAASRGLPDLYVLAGLSFLLKVIMVPLVVSRLLRDTSAEIAGPVRSASRARCSWRSSSPRSGSSPWAR